MAELSFQIYLSYSQICVFQSTLSDPFNDWNENQHQQGFSWREGSVAFRALQEDGDHEVGLYIDERVPELSDQVVRAFRVPFEAANGNVEIASISDSTPLEISAGKYSVQIEFLRPVAGDMPKIVIRMNKGASDFKVLKADDALVVGENLDVEAVPAT